jgi:hypothetical protein
VLAYVSVANYLSETTKENIALAALIVPLASAFIFAWRTKARLGNLGSCQDRLFSTIGVIAPIIWGGVILFSIVAAISNV